MPAKIDLLPCKEFEITLNDGTVIKGQFGTWCIKRFCDKHNLTLSQFVNIKPEDYSFAHITDMILIAVEHSTRKAKQPFGYTDVDACGWIDQLGGLMGTSLMDLFNHQVSELELPPAPEANDEKKTNLTGQSLPGSSTQVAAA